MNADEIKWISCYDKDIGAINQSLCEKVDKFGYCLVLDEFGSDKATKVQICVLDTVLKKGKPNIMLICPAHLMHSWYGTLVSESGIDFKMISGSSQAIGYFSKQISNLIIVSEDALKYAEHSPVMRSISESEIVWDLIIIDSSLAVDGIQGDLYDQNIIGKAEKLIVFSSVPCGYQQGYDQIKSIVKNLMNDSEKAATVDDIVFDMSAICFDISTPIMRYYSISVYEGNLKRNVVVEKYAFDSDYILNQKRMVDLKTGLPLYVHGGNLFEEYNIPEKKIYTKPVFTINDVQELRAVDKKLDVFIKKLDSILGDANSRIVIYCMSNSTIEYLKKIIRALYPDMNKLLRIDRGDVYNTKSVVNRLENNTSADDFKMVLTIDKMGTNDSSADITHIINYELPDNPVVLEQRSSRYGSKDETEREFIVFCDENQMFDYRILSKVLFGKIYRGLLSGLPGRNVLLDMPNAADLLASMIKDLQYVNGYTAEVSNCFDLIREFLCDYNVKKELKLETAQQVNEYTERKLSMIYGALGITAEMSGEEIDEKSLKSLLKPILERYENALLYLDDQQTIVPIKGDELKECLYSEQYNDYKTCIQTGDIISGLNLAKAALSDYISESKGLQLRACVDKMGSQIKLPIILNAWRYLTDQYVINQSFKEFIKNYNEGVM